MKVHRNPRIAPSLPQFEFSQAQARAIGSRFASGNRDVKNAFITDLKFPELFR
jgi:hypothetical protein